MEKANTTKKGTKAYIYYIASWRGGGKVRNFPVGSTRKTSLQAAGNLKKSTKY